MTGRKITPKNDLFLNCRRKMKQLLKKELSNVAPASVLKSQELLFVYINIPFHLIVEKEKPLVCQGMSKLLIISFKGLIIQFLKLF